MILPVNNKKSLYVENVDWVTAEVDNKYNFIGVVHKVINAYLSINIESIILSHEINPLNNNEGSKIWYLFSARITVRSLPINHFIKCILFPRTSGGKLHKFIDIFSVDTLQREIIVRTSI